MSLEDVIDARVPRRFEDVREMEQELLKHYDRHVLNDYCVGEEFRIVFFHPEVFDGLKEHVVRLLCTHSSESAARSLMENMETLQESRIANYAVRRQFLDALQVRAGLAFYFSPDDKDLKCANNLVIGLYDLLSEMIVYSLRKGRASTIMPRRRA
jgi:hypothetical protein